MTMRLPATLLLPCALMAGCSLTDPTRDHGSPGSLRAAIFARYDELSAAHALPRANGPDHADFDDVVAPFLRPGMRFDDAAAVLKQNGFHVGAMPPRPLRGERWADESRFDLLSDLQVANYLIGQAVLGCQLAAAVPLEQGTMTVGKATCRLSTSSL